VHARVGQGKWLSDDDMLGYIRAILRLRTLADAITVDCLLPQTPFGKQPRPKGFDVSRPSKGEKAEMRAWLEAITEATPWAEKKISLAKTRGCSLIRGPPGEDVEVAIGDPAAGIKLEPLLRIPEAKANELDAAYAAVTGEPFSGFSYLRLLNYTMSDYCEYQQSDEEREREREKAMERERLFKTSVLIQGATPAQGGMYGGEGGRDGVRGWAVRCIHWGED
jgi:hypothetical protein